MRPGARRAFWLTVPKNTIQPVLNEEIFPFRLTPSPLRRGRGRAHPALPTRRRDTEPVNAGRRADGACAKDRGGERRPGPRPARRPRSRPQRPHRPARPAPRRPGPRTRPARPGRRRPRGQRPSRRYPPPISSSTATGSMSERGLTPNTRTLMPSPGASSTTSTPATPPAPGWSSAACKGNTAGSTRLSWT